MAWLARLFARMSASNDHAPPAGVSCSSPDKPAKAPVEDSALTDAVAVVGIDCRFPGAEDWRSFWRRLCERYDGVGEVPEDREGWRRPEDGPDRPGWMDRGGFIDDAFAFDAAFFSISPRESELMDPQQRMLLQSVWRAVEDAGYRMSDLSQRHRVGVFVAISSMDFSWELLSRSEPAAPQMLTGLAHSISANRISFAFNLRGPSESVDTACSSALVALHRARLAIQAGDCDCAIVAGVNVMLCPITQASFGKAGMLSDEGLCRTFDQRASGYVRGEGVSAVLVKPRTQAIADGDHVYGLVRGTAVNHGGNARTLTSPSAFAQASVIRAAQESAGVSAGTISYVEAHGTATIKGDPVEVLGLKRAFGRAAGVRCGIGAVKANIGHLEPAAGMAGLVKVLLSMRHGQLPGQVNHEIINPSINLEGSPFFIVDRTMPWERPVLDGSALPRRAGLSAFGFGGTNAHAVLEEFYVADPGMRALGRGAQLHVLPLSARTPASLAVRAAQLSAFLSSAVGGEAVPLVDVAYTLQSGREALEQRLVVICTDIATAVESLRVFARDEGQAGRLLGTAAQDSLDDEAVRQLALDWIAGGEVDWRVADPVAMREGRRMSLPAYPFERSLHVLRRPRQSEGGRALQPWIDENVSTLGRTRFRKWLDPHSAALRDCLAKGGELPDAVAQQMMMQAAILALGRDRVAGLHGVEWTAPLLLSEACNVFVDVEASANEVVCTLVRGDAPHVAHALARVLAPLQAGVPGEASAAPDLEAVGLALRAYLVDTIAKVTRLPAAQIDPGQTFDRFGLDSTLIMEATQAVELVCGPVPQTLFFEHATLDSLAEHLLATCGSALQSYFGATSQKVAGLPHAGSGTALPPDAAAVPAARSGDHGADAIAIVGIAGRYPRGQTLEEFWRHLSLGLDLVTTVPAERWNVDSYFDPRKGAAGKTYCKWGSFIEVPERFDAALFNISPTEARVLDPQERQFLEVAWAALEDAGYARKSLAGRPVGVFVGAMWSHYQMVDAGDGADWLPSSSFASIANRVSYAFDFRGPSVAVDTMCASSLSAIHLACRSLRQGECTVAVAGGVNLSLHVNKYLQLSQSRFLASHGRCKSFGEGGDGFVPGEGVGAVLLKPLEAALRDGDFIHAVIRGSATNHGGKTHGYTVPNPRAQTAVVREALADAGVLPDQISYVEAHGTGTALGDPIEIRALREVFGPGDAGRSLRAIGSVKSNLGHLEAAAGIAGLTKVVLQLRQGQIAPSIHSERLNPAIDFAESGFAVAQLLQEWPRSTNAAGQSEPRRAGVSSFGAGGTNAHVIVEEFMPATRAARDVELIEQRVRETGLWIPLSAAHAPQRLRRATDLQLFLQRDWPRLRAQHGLTLLDLAMTLQSREELGWRAAVLAVDENDLARRLDTLVQGEPGAEVVLGGKPVRPLVSAGLEASADPVQRAAQVQAWVAGLGAFPVAAPMAGIQPRRVPLPTLVFMGSSHWITDQQAPAEQAPQKEHALFRKLTVLRG